MSEYSPLDISSWFNVGLAWIENTSQEPAQPGMHEPGPFPHGECLLHGLPFRFGTDPAHCLAGFGTGGSGSPVLLPVSLKARWLIFALRLLESHLHEGEAVGVQVATLRLEFESGSFTEAPIRERFEISVVPPRWGQLPFLAVPDQQHVLMPRNVGAWRDFGLRQQEFRTAWPGWFVLWAFANPRPEESLARIEVRPLGRRFVLGAMTFSTYEEDPFALRPRQPVIVRLVGKKSGLGPLDVAIDVDRGVATYAHALITEEPPSRIQDSTVGWGQLNSAEVASAYVEVAATPSATLRIREGDADLGAVGWGHLLKEGIAGTPLARLQIAEHGRNWVHVRVEDADTGQPVACRVHFRSPDGIPYQPYGHPQHLSDLGEFHLDVGSDVRLGDITFAYVDGACQGWLPSGELVAEVARGFEYEPLRATVTVKPGQRSLTLQIKRWIDMNADRWFSGDTHVHNLSTTGALLEGAGEDLNVINLLQSQWGHLFTNTEDFLGRPVESPHGRTVVYTSQENRQHILGHLTLLGLKHPVMPWCSGGPDEAELGGPLETTLSHWADECHAQEGTVILPHLPDPNGEPACLVATGRVDALEMLQHDMFNHYEYYRYLNAGYRIPLVGGTDKMSAAVPVGLYRTYVAIPPEEPFSYETWCRHLRLGRTFLSGGPLLWFSVEGAAIGETLNLPAGPATLEVYARARGIFPMHTLEVVQDGRVVASTEEAMGTHDLELRAKIRVDGHTWIAARVGGQSYIHPIPHHDVWRRGIMAHSSPIYVAVGGPWEKTDPEALHYMLTLIEGSLEYIRHRAARYAPGQVTHHHGEPDHLAFLERPFHEARQALRSRLSNHHAK